MSAAVPGPGWSLEWLRIHRERGFARGAAVTTSEQEPWQSELATQKLERDRAHTTLRIDAAIERFRIAPTICL